MTVGVVIAVVIMIETATQVQILDKAVCISFYANAPRKGMNPFCSPLIVEQTKFFSLG